nr:hypothetical protein [Tanacetum cinerariifolium]
MWTAEEKKNQKINHIARSLLIQGLLNDIYSLIDSNNSAKELWDALERNMLGSEYGEQDRKAVVLYKYETFKATERELLLDTYIRYLQVINDLKKCGYKKDNCDVNEAMGYKKKAVMVTSHPLALVAKKTKVSKCREKVIVQSESKGSDDEDINSEERSSSAKETIAKVSYYTSGFESRSEHETSEYYDNSTNYGLFVDNDDDQEIFHNENHIVSQIDHDESEVNHNYSEEKDHLVDKLITKFKQKIAKCQKCIEKENQQSKDLENQNKHLQDKYDVLQNQVNTFEEKNNELNEQIKVLNEKNDDLLAQTDVLQEQLKVKHVVIDTHTECQAQYAKLE